MQGDPTLSLTLTPMSKTPPTWESIVVRALKALGGRTHLAYLYAKVACICEAEGRWITPTYQAKVRQVCQKSKRIVQDVPRSGVWRLADQG